MNETLNKIVKELEESDLAALHPGLNGGLMGLSLFFFYYSRFHSNAAYEDFAYGILETVLTKIENNVVASNYAYGLSGIGSCIDFLSKEKFVEIDSEDYFEELDNRIIESIKLSPVLDYGFQTGLIGLCNYFILHQGNKTSEVLKITLDQICSGFAIPGFPKHPIDTVFLMPSEILRDIKLFLRKIEKLKFHAEQINLLKFHIEKFENEHTILQTNCLKYYKIQYLRETVGFENKPLSKDMLDNCVANLSDKAIQGLTWMYYEKPTLPNVWKIL